VIKFAQSSHNIQNLAREVAWMTYLARTTVCPDTLFEVPVPVRKKGKTLFILDPFPRALVPYDLPSPVAIIYQTGSAYFDYPNEDVCLKNNSRKQIQDIFFRNARILGHLTARGIVHTALIPLFHNRIQQARRADRGTYLWEHGGRLDQWLDSCRYPNFAASGIRDFEHLTTGVTDPGHYIGEHLLSFFLVLGSYFRNREPHRRGNGSLPVCDTRDLFDKDLFTTLAKGVCQAYYKGMTQRDPDPKLFDDFEKMVESMIETMGMDQDMTEVLRVRDQQEMTWESFIRFLKDRGVADPDSYTKDTADIILVTGPHLGEFNRPISIPRVITFLLRITALCVSDRFLMENTLKY
jgi:hypothetical protein